MPLGGFVVGGLGQLLGVRSALWFCALGSTPATVPLLTMRFWNRTVGVNVAWGEVRGPARTMAG
jgi:hypothetical protein